MDVFTQALAAAAFCVAVLAIVWAVRGRLLAPKKSRGKILTVVELRGGAEDMEQLCMWLDWIRNSGGDMDIVIVSDELSPEAERRARMLMDDTGGKVVSSGELIRMIGDRLWQEKKTT